MSVRPSIIFNPVPASSVCWTCECKGLHHFHDRSVNQNYCDQCADGAIGVDRLLHKYYRKPSKSELVIWKCNGR